MRHVSLSGMSVKYDGKRHPQNLPTEAARLAGELVKVDIPITPRLREE
jgi:hypothetical protein